MQAKLMALEARQSEAAESLAAVERQIFELEESYYNDTPSGNLMRGFDGYLDSRSAPLVQKRRMDPENRWFSYSSWTFWYVVPLRVWNTHGFMPSLALYNRTRNPLILEQMGDPEVDAPPPTASRSHKKGANSVSSSNLTANGGDPPTLRREGSRTAGISGGRKKKRRRKGDEDDDDDD